MKLILSTSFLFLFFSFCTPKQSNNNRNIQATENIHLTRETDEIKLVVNAEGGKLKDTFILGIPYARIDSLKKSGEKHGGHAASDWETAMYLRLADSTREIGPYKLRYNGQLFVREEFNKKNSNQIDAEIIEERKGIVSVKKRISDKPEYFPLLKQQIEFYNEKNQLVNTYSINKNNPFLNDKSKKIKESVYPPPNNKSELIAKSDENWKQNTKRYYSYNRFHIQTNGYVIVEYQLFAMDSHEGILKSISTLVVLDSTGKEITRLNELENMLHYYWMVSGGKYLMVNGGGILGEGFQRLEKSFLKIYEVNTKTVIYEEVLDDTDHDFTEFYESESPYKISVSTDSYKKTKVNLFTEYIFDLDNRIKCTKIFSQSDWNKITNEGIKYSGNEWLQKFKFDCKTF